MVLAPSLYYFESGQAQSLNSLRMEEPIYLVSMFIKFQVTIQLNLAKLP